MDNPLFYVPNGVVYPPFKNGKYLEEFFYEQNKNKNIYDVNGKLYIPALWTNFQIEGWFGEKREEMQLSLDKFVMENPCDSGYFTVVQHDNGPQLRLPDKTAIYGACSGNVPIPLIYEDKNNTLKNIPKKTFTEKNILCSFVGRITHDLRQNMVNQLNRNCFALNYTHNWSDNVSPHERQSFIETTINSKFALAPRGYGRGSFRFFEIMLLGTIPVYIYDDIEWLPYKDILDYSKFAISIHESQIHSLENILTNINEIKYNEMIEEYNKIKYMFELDYISDYIQQFSKGTIHL